MHAARRTSAALVLGALGIVAFATACSSRLPEVPDDVAIGAPTALPTPRVESNDAAPEILRMHFSTLDVRRGEPFSGEFVTGTNVASVEVRTNLFSIDVPRTGYGRFAFMVHVLDVPTIFIRSYRLRVIARNRAGAEFERDLPFVIR